MGRPLPLLLLLAAGLLPAAAATFGPQPGAPCEASLLATQAALFCASDAPPTTRCCALVIAAVDLGGGVPCLCRDAAEPQLVMAGLDASHLLGLYTACGGLQDGARIADACQGLAATPASIVSSPPAPPCSPAPHRKLLSGDTPVKPLSQKRSSPSPQEHDGAAHAKAVPANEAASPPAPTKGAPSPAPSSSPPSAAESVVLILRYVFTGALYLSPIPTIYRIYRAGAVGAYNVDMLFTTLISCIMWTFYGLHPYTLALVLINGIGIVFQLVYLALFVRYMPAEGRLCTFISIVVIGCGTGILGTLTSYQIKHPHRALGIMGDVASFVMYAGPIRQVVAAWRDNNVENMSVLVALISIASGICWTAYGCIRKDAVLIVSGGFGILSGIGQVGSWLWVRFRHHE